MPFVLTLVASDKPLSAGHLAGVERFIDLQGLRQTGDPDWLDDHKAAAIRISDCLNTGQMKDLRDALNTDRIDVFCSPSEHRRKKLLLADMDSTIVTTETLDELAEYAGIKDKIAAITARAMNGELDFESALKERVGLLKDLPESTLHETLHETELSPGAETFVRTMAKHGTTCVLVSGGFTFFTGAIAKKAGFQYHHGNTLDTANGVLTGTVGEPVLDKHAKLTFLKKYADKFGIDLKDTLAIGDGANDLPMLEVAGLGIGYRPKPVLEDALQNVIRHGDLSTALYVQGYKRKDFV